MGTTHSWKDRRYLFGTTLTSSGITIPFNSHLNSAYDIQSGNAILQIPFKDKQSKYNASIKSVISNSQRAIIFTNIAIIAVDFSDPSNIIQKEIDLSPIRDKFKLDDARYLYCSSLFHHVKQIFLEWSWKCCRWGIFYWYVFYGLLSKNLISASLCSVGNSCFPMDKLWYVLSTISLNYLKILYSHVELLWIFQSSLIKGNMYSHSMPSGCMILPNCN